MWPSNKLKATGKYHVVCDVNSRQVGEKDCNIKKIIEISVISADALLIKFRSNLAQTDWQTWKMVV